MQADISRPTFDAAKHFTSVMHQQGRVQLDADHNEQAAILLHQLRTVIADLLGPAAMPVGAAGFQIKSVIKDNKVVDLLISPGRGYVDGILVENEVGVASYDTTWSKYSNQPDGHLDLTDGDRLPDNLVLGVYLRVWERLITYVQDPLIREVALGDPGPDTAARAKVIWQVAVQPFDGDPGAPFDAALHARFDEFDPRPGLLAARAKRPLDSDKDPCHLPPEAKFRGPENQLYRVEVHSGGPAWPVGAGGHEENLRGATFKWSRENASVVLPIRSIKGDKVFLTSLGRDNKLGLEVGDWVEVTDDAVASRVVDDRPLAVEPQPARPLRRVETIDYEGRSVTLSGDSEDDDCGRDPELHPLLRRWDHASPTIYESRRFDVASDGALPLIEGQWISLEDGVEVRFDSPEDGEAGTYRGGNFWTVPARTVTGDVEWPKDQNGPASRPAAGVRYHYAPLAVVLVNGDVNDHRETFDPVV